MGIKIGDIVQVVGHSMADKYKTGEVTDTRGRNCEVLIDGEKVWFPINTVEVVKRK